MTHLILLRHGQSEWNEEGRFTGWTDIDLSPNGRKEAVEAGRRLKEAGLTFDVAFTSVLKRAIRTSWLVMDEMDLMWVPLHRSWRLNERHYGALQGLSKRALAEEYGKDQVHAWRRGYETRPPPLALTDPRHPRFDPRYGGVEASLLPATESLHDTLERALPFWEAEILPLVMRDKQVLVSAHGNSLRALVKHLDGLSDDEIPDLNIPTGIPLVYEMREGKAVEHHYLASQEELARATGRAAGT